MSTEEETMIYNKLVEAIPVRVPKLRVKFNELKLPKLKLRVETTDEYEVEADDESKNENKS